MLQTNPAANYRAEFASRLGRLSLPAHSTALHPRPRPRPRLSLRAVETLLLCQHLQDSWVLLRAANRLRSRLRN